jgi:hypothetical protein
MNRGIVWGASQTREFVNLTCGRTLQAYGVLVVGASLGRF